MNEAIGFSGPAPICTERAPLRSSTSSARIVSRCAAGNLSGCPSGRGRGYLEDDVAIHVVLGAQAAENVVRFRAVSLAKRLEGGELLVELVQQKVRRFRGPGLSGVVLGHRVEVSDSAARKSAAQFVSQVAYSRLSNTLRRCLPRCSVVISSPLPATISSAPASAVHPSPRPVCGSSV